MSAKVKLSPEDQILFWFSTAPSVTADELLKRIKGVMAQRRRSTGATVRKVKANSRAASASRVGHEGAVESERPQ